jgi:hypothetical protein
MRKRLVFLTFSVAAAHLTACSNADGQSHARAVDRWLDDPVFGLAVNVSRTQYEPLPARVAQTCRSFPRGKFWIFASNKVGNAEYLFVSGFPAGANGDAVENLIVIQGDRCTGQGGDFVLTAAVPPHGYGADTSTYLVPGQGAQSTCDEKGDCRYTLRSPKEEAVVRGLVRDALERGAKAWGALEFRKHVCDPQVQTKQAATSPLVGEALESYCTSK